MGRFESGCFVTGRYVTGCFVGVPLKLSVGFTVVLYSDISIKIETILSPF
jgi:hypothetical protein